MENRYSCSASSHFNSSWPPEFTIPGVDSWDPDNPGGVPTSDSRLMDDAVIFVMGLYGSSRRVLVLNPSNPTDGPLLL